MLKRIFCRFGSLFLLVRQSLVDEVDWGDEAISTSCQRFNKTGSVGRVPENFPELLHGVIEAMVKVHISFSRPQGCTQLFAGHNISCSSHQYREDLKRLTLEFYPDAVLLEVAGIEVKLKAVETSQCSPFLWCGIHALRLPDLY